MTHTSGSLGRKARVRSWLLRAAPALAVGVLLAPPVHAQTPAAAPAPAVRLAPALQRIRDGGVVTIGYRVDASPFAFRHNGQAIGYAIDICNEIVEAMRRDFKRVLRVEYTVVTAQTRFDMVRTGKAHMECGTTINDPQRRKAGAVYSMPYFFSGPRILARTSSPIDDFFDLRGKKVVVVKGTNSIPLLRRRLDAGTLPGMSLTEVGSYGEAFDAIRTGTADAFITLDVLHFGLRAAAERPADYKVVGTYQLLEPIALILPPDDPEMKQYVDRQLAALMLNGTVGRLYEKWFLQPIPPNNRPLEMPMSALLRDQLRWPTDRLGDEIR
jgi:glutamate/aspartate transport system substrate-binding protein